MARRGRLTLIINNVPANTPVTHIQAAVAVARLYGQYPIGDRLHALPFSAPACESFADFARRRGSLSIDQGRALAIMNELLTELKNAVVEGDAERAATLARDCLAAGIPPTEIFEEGIVAGIRETGVLWDCSRYRVPDVILAADAFNEAVAVIEQRLHPGGDDVRPKIVLGVVEGDVHDLGKNIVVAMLRGAGLHVVDLGVDVPISAFVEAVRREQPRLLGIGAYMSTTMLAVPEVIQALEACRPVRGREGDGGRSANVPAVRRRGRRGWLGARCIGGGPAGPRSCWSATCNVEENAPLRLRRRWVRR